MVHVKGIRIATTCAHHLFPVIGTAHFAYVPDKSIVGLSKIPRFIDILCRRLQVQEELCDQIVGVFYNAVRPGGCAVRIEAVHSCMSARGVREHGARTVVTGVRGSLRANARARMEFLAEAAGTVVGGEMDDAG
jgi:GTP cyclohydrolase I